MGTKSQIVKSTVEVIPSPSFTGLEKALTLIKDSAEMVPALTQEAQELKVTSKVEFIAAGDLLKRIRSVKKTGESTLKPFKDIVKKAADWLNDRKKMHETLCEDIETLVENKMTTYTRQEREAAEKEQRELNARRQKEQADQAEADRKAKQKAADEARILRVAEIKSMLKRGEIGKREAARLLREAGDVAEAQKEQAEAEAEELKNRPVEPMKVLPDTPAVSGLRRRRKYSAKVVNADLIINRFLEGDLTMRRFIMVDEGEVNKAAREVEDSKKLMEMIPGIEATDVDAI